MSDRHNSNWCSKVGCFFCGFLVREDCRSNEDSIPQQQSGEEDALFCTLCNAEVDPSFLKDIIMFFHASSNNIKRRKASIEGNIEKEICYIVSSNAMEIYAYKSKFYVPKLPWL